MKPNKQILTFSWFFSSGQKLYANLHVSYLGSPVPQDVYKNYEACVGKLYGTWGFAWFYIMIICRASSSWQLKLLTPPSHSWQWLQERIYTILNRAVTGKRDETRLRLKMARLDFWRAFPPFSALTTSPLTKAGPPQMFRYRKLAMITVTLTSGKKSTS